MHPVARIDLTYHWHPFTQMRDWLAHEPILIVSGAGATLRDVYGREYLDANASIWTNLHGHRHPRIDAALRRQLGRIAHCSALGLANEPAARLAAALVHAANVPPTASTQGPSVRARARPRTEHGAGPLSKVFFSDDGATAIEVSLKLAYEFARRSGRSRRPKFLSLAGAYHGDTIGAVSLGHIDLFHRPYSGLLFRSDQVMAPYCYRCRFNRAQPERADARAYRKCGWECLDQVEAKLGAQARRGSPYAALIVEPLIQGAAGMIPQPEGWLRRTAELARDHGTQLIVDEVMTAFGRTGLGTSTATAERPRGPGRSSKVILRGTAPASAPLFGCQQEGVCPDFMVLAKGMTGGYLPMAATLTTREVFDAFLGEYEEFKTFFHGHSYTANPLGAAAALANLELLHTTTSVRQRSTLERALQDLLPTLWALPQVGDLRQVGLVVGIELVRNWRTREPFDLREQAGIRVCREMARRGVLTRPVGNVIVLMPPYCTTPAQAAQMVETLQAAVRRVF